MSGKGGSEVPEIPVPPEEKKEVGEVKVEEPKVEETTTPAGESSKKEDVKEEEGETKGEAEVVKTEEAEKKEVRFQEEEGGTIVTDLDEMDDFFRTMEPKEVMDSISYIMKSQPSNPEKVIEYLDSVKTLGKVVADDDEDPEEHIVYSSEEELKRALKLSEDLGDLANRYGDYVGEELLLKDEKKVLGYKFARYANELLNNSFQKFGDPDDQQERESKKPAEEETLEEDVVVDPETKDPASGGKTRFTKGSTRMYFQADGGKITFADGTVMKAERTWENKQEPGKASIFDEALLRADNLIKRIGTKKAIACAVAVAESDKGFRTTKKDGQEVITLVNIESDGRQEGVKMNTNDTKGLKLIVTALVNSGSITASEERYYNQVYMPTANSGEISFMSGQPPEKRKRWVDSYNGKRRNANRPG